MIPPHQSNINLYLHVMRCPSLTLTEVMVHVCVSSEMTKMGVDATKICN